MHGRPQKNKIKRVIVICDDITQIFDFTSNKNFIDSLERNSIDKNNLVEKIRKKPTLTSSESFQSSIENIFNINNEIQIFNNNEIDFENIDFDDDSIIDIFFND